ncbi:MAG TPA: NDP-sugar synthase [Candidatus Aminicenantes bacterium]|nr:NDP-sugar synthase [Candidatus Aminicenantes bacterium]
MMFFVLAGGYGRRAEPLSRIKPKPAFPLGGVPLITRLIAQLRLRGCAGGFVNLHHLAGQVAEAAGDGVRFFAEEELSGSRVLARALPFLEDELLAVNGDTYLEPPLAEMARLAQAPEVDGVLLARRDRSGAYARLLSDGGRFLDTGAAPGKGATPGWMYAGAALFKKRALAKIDEANFFDSLRRERLDFRVAVYDGIWLDLGTPASYFQANWDFMARRGPQGGNALSPGAGIDPRARVRHSILWAEARVGPGADIDSCILAGGPVLENVRHRRSIVSALGVFPLF